MMITSIRLHQPIRSGSRSVIATRNKIISKRQIHGKASSLPSVTSSFTRRQVCNASNILRGGVVSVSVGVGRSPSINNRRIVTVGQQQQHQQRQHRQQEHFDYPLFCQSVRASSSESKKEEKSNSDSASSPVENEIGTKNNNNNNNDIAGSNDSIAPTDKNEMEDESVAIRSERDSTTTTASACETKTENEINNDKRSTASTSTSTPVDKVTNFPWRHSPVPPARILRNDDLSHMPNNVRARFVRRVVACKELNVNGTPWWNAVPLPFGMRREWERELANNFALAYGLAMEELLGSVCSRNGGGSEEGRGRVARVVNDGDGVSIDSSVACEDGDGGEDDDEKVASSEGGYGDEVITKSLEGNSYLNSMLDKKLVERYSLLDPDKCSLKLTIRPMDAKLHSIFAVPLITRDIVEKKPHLKGSYQKIEKAFADSKSYNTGEPLFWYMCMYN
mmetsp:Transcript_9173/g.16584  ORF Transcript_9173/g.16584 Transcript_9173/m.16584 type:complete len:449 (-) Transcript_9173:560-1906(-)